MNSNITNGWLIVSFHRIKLSTVERYEQRDTKVLLYGLNWAHAIDCAAEEDAQGTSDAILSLLDGFFAPKQS
jgi:hypothetical protein